MKNRILLLVIVMAVMACGRQSPDDYVWTGQLYLTARHNTLEKLKGKVLEFKQYSYVPKEENGKVIKGRFSSCFIEQYNESGVIMSFVSLDSTGKIKPNVWTVKTEVQDKILSKAMYYLRDTLRAYSKNTYTGNRLTEMKYFNPENDTLYMSIVYTYDQNGLRVKWQALNYEGEPQEYAEFMYSQNESVKQSMMYSATGELTQQTDWDFNENGERVGNRVQNFSNGIVTNDKNFYEYDKKGNIIKWILYKDDKPYMIREREIKYYD